MHSTAFICLYKKSMNVKTSLVIILIILIFPSPRTPSTWLKYGRVDGGHFHHWLWDTQNIYIFKGITAKPESRIAEKTNFPYESFCWT